MCSLSRPRTFDGTRTALYLISVGAPLSRTDFLRKGFLRDCRGRAYQDKGAGGGLVVVVVVVLLLLVVGALFFLLLRGYIV